MLQFKVSEDVRAPVRFLNSSGAPVTGVVSGDVTADLYYADGSTFSVDPTGLWNETASGAYQLTITPTVIGPVQLIASVSGANDFVGVFDVVDDFASDAVASADAATTAATNAGTLASGAVTAANAAAASALATLNAQTGGWTLDPVLNQLVIYSTDNVTVLARFNCFNSVGNPSVTDVYSRVKV